MIFLQWFQVTLGFIAMLYFVSNGIAYSLDYHSLDKPDLVQMSLMLFIFWAITFANFRGTNITKNIATYAFFIGILFPVIILSILGILYITGDNIINITFSMDSFLPDFSKLSTLVVVSIFYFIIYGSRSICYSRK